MSTASLWGGQEIVTWEEITVARAVLSGYEDVLRTPLLTDWPLGSATKARISLKMESLQTTGSFKLRGMRYKLHNANVKALRSAGIVRMPSPVLVIVPTRA